MRNQGYFYYIEWRFRKYIRKICKTLTLNKYRREYIADRELVGAEISKLIQSGKPFMAARLGANESFTMRTFEFSDEKRKKKAAEQLCQCAGFFPEDFKEIENFHHQMIEAFSDVDILGVLDNPAEGYFVNKYTPKDCKVTVLYYFECFFSKKPWSSLLKGKKVLIVHPFYETIIEQYKKRNEIFPGKEILPEFELVPYKAVQTIAGTKDFRFETWFQALDTMTEEIKGLDFDIALLGCGAYGFPLAARIKQMGKQAIHIGGGLQLFFGIKGKRWDDMDQFSKLYNENWVYPRIDERPQEAEKVENACYW